MLILSYAKFILTFEPISKAICSAPNIIVIKLYLGFPGGSDSKASACSVGDLDSMPGLRRFLGGGHDNPLQYSCLENPMDRAAWRAAVLGVTKSWMGLGN